MSLTAIAVGLIHLRRAEVRARHEIQRIRQQQVSLRRTLWDQETRIAELAAPHRVRWRARHMPLQLIDKHKLPEVDVSEPDDAADSSP